MNKISETASNGEAAADRPNSPGHLLPDTSAEGSVPRISPVDPLALLVPKHHIDLIPVAMGGLPETQPIEMLVVQELKGVGAAFTPKLTATLAFKTLPYKPDGEFDTTYQIIAGPLLQHKRLLGRLKTISFVPVFSWATFEVVLLPLKATRYGARVMQALQSLQPRFPNIKVYVEWDENKRRHTVHDVPMTDQERELVGKVIWPAHDQMIGALQMQAFDNIDNLAAANADVRIIMSSREVD